MLKMRWDVENEFVRNIVVVKRKVLGLGGLVLILLLINKYGIILFF